MLVKKLLARFINDKVLQNAEHCYVATAGITEEGFDLLRSRLPRKCYLDIVTGLDEPTDPAVLKRILKEYGDRVSVMINTRNVFHANVYIFDMPYRKRLAFVSSGSFSMEGFSKNEELSWQLETEKEVETIKSWFTGFYEDGLMLTEKLVEEYETIYPMMKERELSSKEEKRRFNETIISADSEGKLDSPTAGWSKRPSRDPE